MVDHGNFPCFVGGAERLIVDAAMELSSHGHDVHIFTSHHDRNRCFEETVSGEHIHHHMFCHFFLLSRDLSPHSEDVS